MLNTKVLEKILIQLFGLTDNLLYLCRRNKTRRQDAGFTTRLTRFFPRQLLKDGHLWIDKKTQRIFECEQVQYQSLGPHRQ